MLHRGAKLLEQATDHHPVDVQGGLRRSWFEFLLTAQIAKVLDKVLGPFGPLVVYAKGRLEATTVPFDEDSGQAEVVPVVPDLELFQLVEELIEVDAFVVEGPQRGTDLLLALHEEGIDLGLHRRAERFPTCGDFIWGWWWWRRRTNQIDDGRRRG